MKRLLTFAAILAVSMMANAQRLVILHTNDTHSQIEPIRTGRNAGQGGVDRRLQLIDSVRAEYGKNKVLLLDAGDFNQGTPYYTIGEGKLELQLVNTLGYDVVTIGNHEFDDGQQSLAGRLAMAKFSTVCCNYSFEGTPLETVVKPYTIIKRGGLKIGIVGATSNLESNVLASNLDGIKRLNTIEEVNRYADFLKKEKKCDLVIFLSHLGFAGGSLNNPSDHIMAAESENIDIIIGGHSHTFIKEAAHVENRIGKDVIIVTAGAKGAEVGELKIY